MIGQCCNFHGINIMRYFFIILADYSLRHLVNDVAIHIYIHDYIRMEITVFVFENFTASIVDFMIANSEHANH